MRLVLLLIPLVIVGVVLVATRRTAVPVDLAGLDARRDEVMTEYGAFLSDIVQIAAMPLLLDQSCPATDEFTRSLVRAEDARSAAHRDARFARAYSDAVESLEKAWRVARGYARRKGHSTLDAQEQQAVRRAQSLLEVALDEHAFPAERRAALYKSIHLLRTVVELPPQAVAEIEQQVDHPGLEE